MDYVYCHFRTGALFDAWSTAGIEAYLRSCGLFPEGEDFTSQTPFLSISLMNVQDWERWSGRDYDPVYTNYIAAVTSTDWYWGVTQDARIQAVFDGLEALLHTKMQQDW